MATCLACGVLVPDYTQWLREACEKNDKGHDIGRQALPPDDAPRYATITVHSPPQG